MKITKKSLLFVMAVLLAPLMAKSFVILHTNDTHSAIDPDKNGNGGILQRKAIVDSVRKAEKDVLLVDAGDMVQGTLYFKYFGGDVEYPLFDMMGYDVRILGNHEFDNGLDELAKHWRQAKSVGLSANYDFAGTPAEGIFRPYVVRQVGDKKVGFVGINIDPSSLISAENIKGVKFSDPIETLNRIAAELKHKQGCDIVVAVTHVGYESENGKPSDIDLAKASRDVDIIIGGHSHTTVDPAKPAETPYLIPNADGREVLVAQTGKNGRNLGYIKVEESRDGKKSMEYRLIPVTDRFDKGMYDRDMQTFLQRYKAAVDSVNNVQIGYSSIAMSNERVAGPFGNWAGDFAAWRGRQVIDSLNTLGANEKQVDLGLMNVGGIRQPMAEGPVSEGQILSTFPFSNRLAIIGVKGADLVETMRVAAARGGEAVSGDVTVVMDNEGNVVRVLVDGKEVDPEREYVVATIDYVAEGNDDMTPMARHRNIWRDHREISIRILEYVKMLTRQGLTINPDTRPRFVTEYTNAAEAAAHN